MVPAARIGIFLWVGSLLGACSGEPHLVRVATPAAGADDLAGPDDPPPQPDGAPSPWGDLDPGDLPDVHFGVAFSEDCPPSPGAGCTDVGFAVIDLTGQVLAEFEVPGSETWRPDRLVLHPGGFGQFLVVTDRWLVPPASHGVPSVHEPWQVWRADGYDGSMTRLAIWDNAAYGVYLPQADRLVDLGEWGGYLQAGMLANAPDRLYLWPGGTPMCGSHPADLLATHVTDPAAPDQSWPHEDFLTPELATTGYSLWPWHFGATLDDGGASSMLFGVSPGFCLDTPEGIPSDLVAWSPDDGVLWRRELSDPWYAQNDLQDAEYSGAGGGGVLRLSAPTEEPGWTVDRPDGSVEGSPDDSLVDHRPGSLLDPVGPTLSVVGTHPDGTHDEIEIHHLGEKVWTIDRLRFGLQSRPVWLLDVVVIPQVPGDDG